MTPDRLARSGLDRPRLDPKALSAMGVVIQVAHHARKHGYDPFQAMRVHVERGWRRRVYAAQEPAWHLAQTL